MKAITVKNLAPTDYKGSRLKAFDQDGNSVTIPRGNQDRLGAYHMAAIALCEKMGWFGKLVGGSVKDGYVFVFVGINDEG